MSKKQNNSVGLSLLLIVFGLTVGVLIGSGLRSTPSESMPNQKVGTQSSTKPGTTKNNPYGSELQQDYQTGAGSISIYDAMVVTQSYLQTQGDSQSVAYTSVQYVNPRQFQVKVHLKNNSSKQITNVYWNVYNNTTAQALSKGKIGSIAPKSTILAFNSTISTDSDGKPLIIRQGDNKIDAKIYAYDQQGSESNSSNNISYYTIHVPVVDASLQAEFFQAKYSGGVVLYDQTVRNSGEDYTAPFYTGIFYDAVSEGSIYFDQGIQPNNTRTMPLTGKNSLTRGYHLAQVFADNTDRLVEPTEANGPGNEPNNKLNTELNYNGYSNSSSLTYKPYTASQNWFMVSPTFVNNEILIPIINIGTSSATTKFYFSFWANSSCSGSSIGGSTYDNVTMAVDRKQVFKIGNLNSTQLGYILGKTVCVRLSNNYQETITRTLIQ